MADRLESEILQLFRGDGFELLEIVRSGRAGNPQIRVIADRRVGGLTIEDCTQITRRIQHLIDEKVLLASEYRLEVTSPGLEYPLRVEWQFVKNIGRLLKVKIITENGFKEISARLIQADRDGITLSSDQTEWKPRYEELVSARVLPEFKTPSMESKR